MTAGGEQHALPQRPPMPIDDGGEVPAPPRFSMGETATPLPEGSSEHAAVDPAAVERLRGRLASYMAKKGLRSTAQRRLIVDTFFEGASHMTIEDLLNEVRSRDRGIGYATVYRTLKLLAECGVASERKFGDGLSRYELADDASAHHDHLICVSCGKITEFEEPRIEALQDEVAARNGFTITSHKHEMYGICADCRSRGARPDS